MCSSLPICISRMFLEFRDCSFKKIEISMQLKKSSVKSLRQQPCKNQYLKSFAFLFVEKEMPGNSKRMYLPYIPISRKGISGGKTISCSLWFLI